VYATIIQAKTILEAYASLGRVTLLLRIHEFKWKEKEIKLTSNNKINSKKIKIQKKKKKKKEEGISSKGEN
jgi:hypothetical protein